ncbi:MAG: hypothetical protein F6K62_22390 [Sphaerospermopsis sp. SIO1G2]|nr:hypothetical protein [Sphaerospermopsis sp. SIO1G2]
MLDGRGLNTNPLGDDFVYVAINMHYKAHVFELPPLPETMRWHLFCDTGRRSPHDIVAPGDERPCGGQQEYVVESRAVVVLVGRV